MMMMMHQRSSLAVAMAALVLAARATPPRVIPTVTTPVVPTVTTPVVPTVTTPEP